MARVGGAFLAQGADTCVYDPPVACEDDPTPAPTGHVSRIVRSSEGEVQIQSAVRAKVLELEKTYPGQVAPYVNLATSHCTPDLKKSDIKNAKGASCSIHSQLQTEGVKDRFDNLITPKQGADLYKTATPDSTFFPALRKLFRAILLLNSVDVVHSDLHTGNIAWVGNKLVVHDWGRAIATRGDFINKTLAGVQADLRYLKKYPQYVRPCELTEECGLAVYSNRLSVQQIMAVPRLMRVWDTLGLLGFIHDDVSKIQSHPQFNGISDDYTRVTIDKIKNLARDGVIVKIENVQAIMDGYFNFLEKTMAPAVPPLVGVPRIATPRDDSMRGMPTPKDDSMHGPSWSLGPSSSERSWSLGGARKKPRTQTRRFCKCIKSVKKTGRTERGAIAICVHSVLQSRGRTMKRFKCGRTARLVTQKLKRRA